MSNKPFFSVVLPTLNRADYLPFAIQSILNQTFGDFELIVSDNSSTDNTEQIVKSFSDERIRYVKTEKILPMYDSWEFALGFAEGEYITFLGDDDAHSKVYLESLKKVYDEHNAQIVSCRVANYYYSNFDNYKSASLTTNSFSNKLTISDSRQLIKEVFVDNGLSAGNPLKKFQVPQLINTIYHHSIFSEIKKNLGRVFPRVLAGDFYLVIVALNFTEKYYFLDSPLSFHGISPESTTSSITNQPKGTDLKKKQPELANFKKVPLDIYVPYNFVADALLLARSDLGDDLDYLDVDLTGYFINIYDGLLFLKLHGHNIAGEIEEFFAALDKQKPSVREKVNSAVSNKKSRLKNELRRKFHKNFVFQYLRDLRNSRLNQTVVIEGSKKGFKTITECAEFVEHKFLRDYASNN